MKTIEKLIQAGVAACALASVSLPALSYNTASNTAPDVDFEWYANVGRSPSGAERFPAPRAGYIWAPGHYEWTGSRQAWMPGVWVRDEQATEWKAFRSGPSDTISYTTGPLELRDSDGNVIPTDPGAYNVDSARR